MVAMHDVSFAWYIFFLWNLRKDLMKKPLKKKKSFQTSLIPFGKCGSPGLGAALPIPSSVRITYIFMCLNNGVTANVLDC